MIVRFIIQKKTIIFLLLAPSFAQVHFLAGIVDEEGEDIGKNIIKKRTLILKNIRFFCRMKIIKYRRTSNDIILTEQKCCSKSIKTNFLNLLCKKKHFFRIARLHMKK
jgi:hypothetical protein